MAIADAWVDLHVDGDHIGTETKQTVKKNKPKIEKESDLLGRSMGKRIGLGLSRSLKGSIRGVTKSILPAFASIGIASAGIVAANAVTNVLSLAGSLSALGGSLGVIPAMAGAAAGALATLLVGFKGVGEALKNMGDPEKFAEALKNIAPNARSTVMAIKGLSTEFKNLKLDVQNRLFANLGTTINTLGKAYLPVLSKGMGQTADALNSMFKGLGATLSSDAVTADIAAMFAAGAAATKPLTAALQAFLPALTEIGAVSATFLTPLTESMAGAAERFGAFIQTASDSGALKEWVDTGLTAFGQLWQVLKDLGGILWSILSAAQNAGGSTLGTLSEALGRIRDVVEGEAFQTGLTAFFKGIQAGSAGVATALPAIGQMLGTLGSVLGPLVAKLGPMLGGALTVVANALIKVLPYIGKVLEALGPAFVTIVETVAGVLEGLGPIIADIAAVIGPVLATGVQALAGVLKSLLPVVGKVVKILGPVLGKVFEVLGALIPPIVDALAPLITMLAEALVPIIESLLPPIVEVASVIVELITSALKPLLAFLLPILIPVIQFLAKILIGTLKTAIEGVMQVIRGLMNFFEGLWNFIKNVFMGNWSEAWEGLKQAFFGLWEALVGAVKVAISVGFLGAIKKGLGAISGVWKGAWNAIKSGISAVFAWIRNLFVRGLNGYINLWKGGLRGIKNLVVNIFNAIKTKISTVWNTIKTGLRSGWNFIRDKVFTPFKNALETIKGAFTTVKDGIKTAWDKVAEIAAKPVRFVIQTVFNKGIIKGFNWLSEKIGGPTVKQIPLPPGLATGGVLPGYTPGRDVHDFYSPTGGRLRLSGGEAVMRPEFTRLMGGAAGIKALNAWARRGGKGMAHAAGGVLGGSFADGGVLGWIRDKAAGAFDWVKDKAGAIWNAVSDPLGFIKSKIPEIPGAETIVKYTRAMASKSAGLIVEKIKGLWKSFKEAFDKSGVGGVSSSTLTAMRSNGTGYKVMSDWVKNNIPGSMISSAYRPGAMTATGFVSNHALGRAVDVVPPSMMAFTKILEGIGLKNIRELYYSPAVGKNVLNGKYWNLDPITRANHFNHVHWAMRQGGLIPTFDSGGTLPPGLSTVYNGTGRPETLIPRNTAGATYIVDMAVSIDDLSKLQKIEDFIDMMEKARMRSRKVERSGTVKT